MTSSLNKLSTLVEHQLPQFIRDNHPVFVEFLQKYYEFLEQPGNPVYELKKFEDNYDIDATRESLLRYFKNKILPSFPEETEMTTERIIKASRDFYAKKGTPESFKFLFRALYDKDVDIFFPKTQILKASDGKWVQPQAFRMTLTTTKLASVLTLNNGYFQCAGLTNGKKIAVGDSLEISGTLSGSAIIPSYSAPGPEAYYVISASTASDGTVTFQLSQEFGGSAISTTQGTTTGLTFKNITKSSDSLDLNVLEKKKAYGSISRASCIIESTNRTIDKSSNKEIVEFYVTNVNRLFQNGEYLEIDYVDENGLSQTFSERIIGAISNIKINPKRRGTKYIGADLENYLPGDPVVISGGLDLTSDTRRKAVAVVGNVTTGSIDSVTVVEGGYGFRTFPNSVIDVISDSGVGSNVIVSLINDSASAIVLNYNTDAIVYKKNAIIQPLSAAIKRGSSGTPYTITGTLGTSTCVFTGYIDNGTAGNAGTILHITGITSGALVENMLLTGTGTDGSIPTGTYIVSQISGTSLLIGSSGSPIAMTATTTGSTATFNGYIDNGSGSAGSVLHVATSPSATLVRGMYITGSGIPSGTYLMGQLTGSAGSTGTYTISTGSTGNWRISTKSIKSFQGYITGNTMNVVTAPSTTIATGDYVTGGSIPDGVYIYTNLTGTGSSSSSSWTLDGGPTSDGRITAATTFTGYISGTTLYVVSGLSGVVSLGMYLKNAAGTIPFGTSIVSQLTGSVGGTGTYQISASLTIASSGSPITITADKRFYFQDTDTLTPAYPNILYAQTEKTPLYWDFANNFTTGMSTTLNSGFAFDSLSLYPLKAISVINGGSFFTQVPSFQVYSLYESDYTMEEGIGDVGLIQIPSGDFNSYNATNKTLNLVGTNYSSEDGFYVGWRIFCEKHFRTIVAYNGATKTITLDRKFEKNVTTINILPKNLYLDPRPNIATMGRVAHIDIVNAGTGYEVGDVINFIGSGYGAAATVTSISGAGGITGVTLSNRGEGYPIAPDALIYSPISTVDVINGGIGYSVNDIIKFTGGGSGAAAYVSGVDANGTITSVTVSTQGTNYPPDSKYMIKDSGGVYGSKGVGANLRINYTKTGGSLHVILMADGESLNATTGKIGQVRDIILLDRGSDYISTPTVSLKIYDLKIDAITSNESIVENDIVYQGTDLENSTFQAIVDSYYSANNILRVFDYSGVPKVDNPLYVVRAGSTVVTTYPRSSYIDVLDNFGEVLYRKTYPWRYGDGKARATAEFLNGLIRYNGYYLNTDGQVSSDKKIQDDYQYHNFSYALSSEVQYQDYAKSILDIAHPSGTRLIPTFVKNYGQNVGEHLSINVNSIVLATNTMIGSCNVGMASTLATASSVTVDGGDNNEKFNALANVGDMIVINSGNSLVQFVKTITVIDEATTYGNNHITIESPCILIGQGRANTTVSCTDITITNHANTLAEFINATNDKIVINTWGSAYANLTVGAGNTTSTINLSTSNFSPSSTTGYYNGFKVQIVDGTGVSGASNTAIITAYNGTTKIATLSPSLTTAPGATSNVKITGDVVKTIVSISGDTITLNSSTGITATKSNLVYQVIPKLNVVDYEIIKTDYIPS